MTEPPLHAVLHHLRRVTDADEVTDAELLRRFHTAGDQAAFELLAWRHQRLVFQVCRRVLPSRQDAEDAFQVTFLALARRAGTLDAEQPLAGWLHTVAYHAALRVRKQAARRAGQAQSFADTPAPARTDPPGPMEQAELERVLDEEIRRLPERYRLPVILCCLEGKSHEQAARQLGCPTGTLAARLSRARAKLRGRLARRGLGLVVLEVLLAQEAPAAERVALVANTARIAVDAASGKALAPAAVRVLALADALLRGMRLARWRATALLLALACVFAVGATQLVPAGHDPAPPEAVAPPPPLDFAAVQDKGPPADALGDPLPPGAQARLGTVRQWNPEGVRALAVSADGKLMASAVLPGRIRVWNAADGKLLRELGQERAKTKAKIQEYQAHIIEQMEFSPDGKWLATVENVQVVRVWEIATGKELYTVTGPPGEGIRSFAFTPRGDKLVLGAGRDLVLWDLAADKADSVLKGHTGSALALAFSADGKYLVSGGFDQTVRRWEWQAAKPVGEVLGKHENYVTAVAISADGSRVASSGYDPRVRVWDAANAKEIFQLQPWKEKLGVTVAMKVFLSPDGKELWAGGHSPIGRWKVDTGERLPTPAGWFGLPALTADGKWLAVGVDRVRLWDVAAGKVVTDFAGHDLLPAAGALSPDGSLAVTASKERAMHLWDARTGKLLRTLTGPEGGPVWLLFAADGRTLFAAGCDGSGRAIGRWDVATGKALAPLDEDATLLRLQAALSPDGKTLAVLESSGNLRAYDVAAGKERYRVPFAKDKQPFPGPAMRFQGAGDRLTLATVILDKKVHTLTLGTYDAAVGKKLQEWTVPTHKLPFTAIFPADGLAPSPDGHTVIVAHQSGHVYRVEGIRSDVVAIPGVVQQAPPRKEREAVRHLAAVFSPDGRLLATTNLGATIVIREVATGAERLRLTGDQGALLALAFSADSSRLLSLGANTTALVWDLAGAKTGPALAADRLNALWEDLTSPRVATAFAAMKELLGTPAQTVAFIKQRVPPAPAVAAAQIDQWIADLGSDKFAVRQKATVGLERTGTVAVPALRRVLAAKPALEVEQRVTKLLEGIESGVPPRSRLRELRAVELLERIHGPDARQVLETLAGGAELDVVAVDARNAVVRLAAHVGK
jgi:RNA polymerase sigma factor (sigma-70 family)